MKDTKANYHKEWRKKNPKKYAMNQLNYWEKQVKKLEQEESEQTKTRSVERINY